MRPAGRIVITTALNVEDERILICDTLSSQGGKNEDSFTAFWDTAPCSLVEAGLLPRDYTALYPRKLSFSCSNMLPVLTTFVCSSIN
jgi:hypothetical protein